ncbi:rho GTPase-activating protein 27 isoform X2 [Brachyhypopomus gauderio]|uniref:rho GTPase-activating protein 27 isoform X2 n=1 Tax=Brachyhypopomus gauderio TaxID=698409 RepID=UPI00404288DD
MSLSQMVLVNFQYEYTTQDGKQVSIKPNERYFLVAKTNDHWWHVCQDENAEPFFIPAEYVTELPLEGDCVPFTPISLLAPLIPPPEWVEQDFPELVPPSAEEGSGPTHSVPLFVKSAENDGHGVLTSSIPEGPCESGLLDAQLVDTRAQPCDPRVDVAQDAFDDTPQSLPSPIEEEGPYTISPPEIFATDCQSPTEPAAAPSNSPTSPSKALNDDIQMLIRAGWDHKVWNFMEGGVNESLDSVKDFGVQDNKDSKGRQETTQTSPEPPLVMLDMPATEQEQSPGAPPEVPAAPPKKDEDDDVSAVYVNVPRTRRSVSATPQGLSSSWEASDTPGSPNTPRLSSEEWEAHTDRESGRPFYYHPASGRSTWDPPLSQPMEPEAEERPPSPSPVCSPAGPSPLCWASGWERVLDENTGRHYFFNPVSGESSWDPPEEQLGRCNSLRDGEPPPLPEEDYPAEEDFSASLGQEVAGSPSSFALIPEYTLAHVKKAFIPRACLDRNAPPGWRLSIDADGAWIFTSEYTQEQWIKSLDDRGQTYYYLRDGSKSQWNLPELSADMGQCHLADRRTLEQDQLGASRTWRNSTGSQDEKFSLSHRRNASDSDTSSSPEMQHNVSPSKADGTESDKNFSNQSSDFEQQKVSNLEKAGILNKTKISENGKKVRKNWASSWTVLHGGILTFHKDPKSTPGSASSRTNQIVTEFAVDLRGATIGWAAKEKSSKKNVLELRSRAGAEFLIQYDTDAIINDWHKVIVDTIRLLEMEHHHSEDEEEISEKSSSTEREDRFPIDRQRMNNGRHASSNSTTEADPKKVRNKLRKFLLKRPTLQSVKDRGYIRENVFGCHLPNLCAQEKRTVPTFVEKCIWTVEKRGLGVDGIYRVSGNLAVIQKLRFKADHEDLNLEEGHWDIHVITGALKLFFRELQEPLFPYSHFNSFVQGIKIPDYNSRVSYMSDLVKSLPPSNHDTMEVLFSHLRKVIEHGEENRMSVQNVAIVFGPTLLKPEVESANLTMYMVFQNQIIEFILNEFETIFHM